MRCCVVVFSSMTLCTIKLETCSIQKEDSTIIYRYYQKLLTLELL